MTTGTKFTRKSFERMVREAERERAKSNYSPAEARKMEEEIAPLAEAYREAARTETSLDSEKRKRLLTLSHALHNYYLYHKTWSSCDEYTRAVTKVAPFVSSHGFSVDVRLIKLKPIEERAA